MTRHHLVVCALALTSLLAATPSIADACATFAALIDAGRAPSLSLERVLIVHDPASQTEHFVREVVFRGQQSRFGFVVPTPTQPQVFEVKESPFDDLERAFPFAPRPPVARAARTRSADSLGDDDVTVIEQKAIGSFTAFIVKATDSAAFSRWLTDNELGTTPDNDAWLAHYVARDFYYVAFRYEPAPGRNNKLRAETVRISFKTPVAYYPYREPRRADATQDKRAIAMWVISPHALAPLTRLTQSATSSTAWTRPFQEGLRHADTPASALVRSFAAIGVDAPQSETFVVQTFEDQKRSRAGFSDALFLPETGVPDSAQADVAAIMATLTGGDAP